MGLTYHEVRDHQLWFNLLAMEIWPDDPGTFYAMVCSPEVSLMKFWIANRQPR